MQKIVSLALMVSVMGCLLSVEVLAGDSVLSRTPDDTTIDGFCGPHTPPLMHEDIQWMEVELGTTTTIGYRATGALQASKVLHGDENGILDKSGVSYQYYAGGKWAATAHYQWDITPTDLGNAVITAKVAASDYKSWNIDVVHTHGITYQDDKGGVIKAVSAKQTGDHTPRYALENSDIYTAWEVVSLGSLYGNTMKVGDKLAFGSKFDVVDDITLRGVVTPVTEYTLTVDYVDAKNPPNTPMEIKATPYNGHLTWSWDWPADPTATDYTFKGWCTDAAGNGLLLTADYVANIYGEKMTFSNLGTFADASRTYYAIWESNTTTTPPAPVTPPAPATPYYAIQIGHTGGGTVDPNGGMDSREFVKKGSSTICNFTPDVGYHVADVLVDGVSMGGVSSYTFSNITTAHTLYVEFVADGNPVHHFPYMIGYADRTFGQDRNLTRAEAAVIFSRLFTQTIHLENSYTSDFSDVTNQWYANQVAHMEKLGVATAGADGTFRGDDAITCEELIAMVNHFQKLDGIQWNGGGADHAFLTKQYITRAEMVTYVNESLDRKGAETVENETRGFADLDDTHWAYDQILAATNG